MRAVLVLVAFCLCVSVGSALYEHCNTNVGAGFCDNKNKECGGSWVAGYCPGPANVQCCVSSCSQGGRTGRCIPTSACSGTTVSGLCPGPANVKCCLSGGGGDGGGGGGAGQCDVAGFAKAWSNPKITAKNSNFDPRGAGDGADARSNLRDAAQGKKVKNSCYGNAPCRSTCLTPKMSNFLNNLAAKGSVYINSIAGGSHSSKSAHYSGRAIDIGSFNGRILYAREPGAKVVIQVCKASGANPSQIFHASLGCGPTCDQHSSWVHCGF